MTPVLTFFNNKGGVGKTSLIYHLAWTFAEMGKCVLVLDLDPQANLTSAFFTDDDIEALWEKSIAGTTIFRCVKPLAGVSDITPPVVRQIAPKLFVLPGDVALSNFEDILSLHWPQSLNSTDIYRPMRVLSSFWQVMQMAAVQVTADIILVDIGPNLGAINRSVLISTSHVVIPLGADLFSLQGLKNLGPALHRWKTDWNMRFNHWKSSNESNEYPDFMLPNAEMAALGYVCQQYSVRMERPVKAYTKWADRIPGVYQETILNETVTGSIVTDKDPNCLAEIKHYRSLIPMGQEHRKPIFKLTPADGAVGSHANAVQDAKRDFQMLAAKIAEKIGVPLKTDEDTAKYE